MTLRRFFVKPEGFNNNSIIISGDEHNHLKNVLRLKEEEQIIVVCGDGYDYYANLKNVGKNATIAEIVKKEPNIYDAKSFVRVYQALTKKDTLSFITQKLTELGVAELALIETTNTTAKDKFSKADKLQAVSNQSVKQCKRSKPMTILNTKKVSEMLKELKAFDLVVFANETEHKNTLKELFEDNKGNSNVAIIIGSEGGFTPKEIDDIISAGAVSVTLGKRILRAETASIALTALVMYHLGELN